MSISSRLAAFFLAVVLFVAFFAIVPLLYRCAISVPDDELDSPLMRAKAKGRFIDPMLLLRTDTLPEDSDRWEYPVEI